MPYPWVDDHRMKDEMMDTVTRDGDHLAHVPLLVRLHQVPKQDQAGRDFHL